MIEEEANINLKEVQALIKNGFSESERWTILLLGWGRTEHHSRVEFITPDENEKQISGARFQMLRPVHEGRHTKRPRQD